MPTPLDNALKLRLSPQVRSEGTASSFLLLPYCLRFAVYNFSWSPSENQLQYAYPTNTTTQRAQDGGRRRMELTRHCCAWVGTNIAGRVSPRAHPRSVSPQQHRSPRGDHRGPRLGRVESRKSGRRPRRDGAERSARWAGERVSARRRELRELYVHFFTHGFIGRNNTTEGDANNRQTRSSTYCSTRRVLRSSSRTASRATSPCTRRCAMRTRCPPLSAPPAPRLSKSCSMLDATRGYGTRLS